MLAGGLLGPIFGYITAHVFMAWEKRNPKAFDYNTGSIPPQLIILCIVIMAIVGFGLGFYWSW